MAISSGEALACRRGGRLVFAGLDLRLPAGGALVLTGSNGSGKSSLLRLLATLLTPAEGRLLWQGEPVAARSGALSRRDRLCGPSRRDQAGADSGRNAALLDGAARRGKSGNRGSARPVRARRGCGLALPLSVGRSAAAAGTRPACRGSRVNLAARRADRCPRQRRRGPADGSDRGAPRRQAAVSPSRRTFRCRCPARRRSGSTITLSRRATLSHRRGEPPVAAR